MDPRGLDGVQAADAAAQLTFEGALVVDLLGELGQAEVRLREDLEAGPAAAALDDAGGGDHQLDFLDLGRPAP